MKNYVLLAFDKRFVHFDIGVKEKVQNVPAPIWKLFYVKFCHVLSRFSFRER